MTRIYLSGPITGHEDYIKNFNKAAEEVQTSFNGAEIINPANLRFVMPPNSTWKEYMRICHELLDMADVIYMLPGWSESKGACIEYGYALAKDITIILAKKEGD